MKASFSLKEIFPCLFAVFVDILGFSLAMPVLIELFSSNALLPPNTPDTVRFAYLAIGLVLYPFFMFFGSSFMGDLSDIVGRKKVLTICMGGFVIGFLVLGLGATTHTLFLIFCGRALTGLTAASLSVTMAAISDLSTPTNKASHMSLVVLIQSIGIVLGPLMAGFLSTTQFLPFGNNALPFYTASFLALIALVWIGAFFQESFERHVGKKVEPLRIFLVFVEVAKHSRIRILASAFLLHQIGIGIYIQLILVYLSKTFQYTSFGMGLFNASLGLWLSLGLLLIPPPCKADPD